MTRSKRAKLNALILQRLMKKNQKIPEIKIIVTIRSVKFSVANLLEWKRASLQSIQKNPIEDWSTSCELLQ